VRGVWGFQFPGSTTEFGGAVNIRCWPAHVKRETVVNPPGAARSSPAALSLRVSEDQCRHYCAAFDGRTTFGRDCASAMATVRTASAAVQRIRPENFALMTTLPYVHGIPRGKRCRPDRLCASNASTAQQRQRVRLLPASSMGYGNSAITPLETPHETHPRNVARPPLLTTTAIPVL
jgi:hypothetical protein